MQLAAQNLITKRLHELVPENQAVDEAVRYSLLSSGKLLRPRLVLAACETAGGKAVCAIDPACAVEMMHTYSLIHDDLPCMDNDDFRRGKATLHKAYNEATAVLAGDYLLTTAFEVIVKASLSAEKRIRIAHILSAGGRNMIRGQMLDLQAAGHQLFLAELQEMHRLKTGCLITAAVQIGAICADAETQTEERLVSFANSFGLAFQIIDDILDVSGGKGKRATGKSSDIENKKATYVSLLGLEGAKEQAVHYLQCARERLSYESPLHTLVEESIDHSILNT